PRDVFVSEKYKSIPELPRGARLGTSSLRRVAQGRGLRPDLGGVPLRGNVDTRIRKMGEGEYAAIILAAAGLKRLGRTEWVREFLDLGTMCPAAGQGALAIETRARDDGTLNHVRFLNHEPSRRSVFCERAALNALGGGCQVPIGAYAREVDGRLLLQAVVARPDGSEIIREEQAGDEPEKLGASVGAALLAKGARRILEEVYS